jgi:hypothetical protein
MIESITGSDEAGRDHFSRLYMQKHINYGCEDGKKSWEVKRRHCYHLIGLESLFQKTPIITTIKRTVQPGDAFEDTAFKPGFEIVKFQTRL